MKKKINVKLTVSMVSLFIGILCIVLSHGNNHASGVGFFFLAVALVFIALNNENSVDKKQKEYDKMIEDLYDELDELSKIDTEEAAAREAEIDSICTAIYKERKQKSVSKVRIKILFIVLAVFFVLVGIMLNFS